MCTGTTWQIHNGDWTEGSGTEAEVPGPTATAGDAAATAGPDAFWVQLTVQYRKQLCNVGQILS